MIGQTKYLGINRLEGLLTRLDMGSVRRTGPARSAGRVVARSVAGDDGPSHDPAASVQTPACLPCTEKAEYQYRLGGHGLVLAAWGAVHHRETAVARAEAEFALVVEGPLLVLGFRFGESTRWSWADPYNWHFAPPGERVVPAAIPLTPESYARLWATLWITVEDVDDGRARVRRAVALRPEFTDALHGVLRAQAQRRFPVAAAARALNRLRSADAPLCSRARVRTRCPAVSAHGSRGVRSRVGQDGATQRISTRQPMNHDPHTSIVVTDGYWKHIRQTRIHHRQYPEVRGEGASPAAAAAHLSRQLARAVDFAQGREVRGAIVRALADVQAFRSADPVRRPVCRDGCESGLRLP